jgi:endonuclease YncB( thermonuclease family)
MRTVLIIIVVVQFFSSCAHRKNNASSVLRQCDYTVMVTGITDGDTFRGLTSDRKEIKFRIYGIDAPELKQAFGQRSKQYLSGLIFGKTVGIKVQKQQDRYRRPVVWVYTEDGKDAGAEMLKAGMAWHFKRFDQSPDYATLEETARSSKKGLWIDPKPVAPWDFR